jgi:XTP/dITP diphosphohydrolase
MKQLLIATHNRDKVMEIRPLLAGLGVELLTLDQVPAIEPVEEDGETLEENALKKAHVVFEKTGIPCLADDTGLEVYYLNNAPGVRSSRFSGPNATYASNVRMLLALMKGVPERRRSARFRCVIAFAAPESLIRSVEGICPGTILESPRGEGGFGYDPVFRPDSCRQTFAEMPIAAKNTLSHRAAAIRAIYPILEEYSSCH